MKERDHLGVAVGQDVAGEAAEGGRPRAARVHDGGDARVDPAQVRVHPGAVEALEDVRVEVDEPRGDDLAPHVDGTRGLRLRDARRDARDRAVLHRDVEGAVETAGGIQHRAALEEEVVHGRSPIDQRVKWSQKRAPAATESGTSPSKR